LNALRGRRNANSDRSRCCCINDAAVHAIGSDAISAGAVACAIDRHGKPSLVEVDVKITCRHAQNVPGVDHL